MKILSERRKVVIDYYGALVLGRAQGHRDLAV